MTTGPAVSETLRLDLPVACDIGRTCWLQQYADHDPSAGVSDYACGSLSYDGHDGTDIRIRDTTTRADVVAAADGVVRAVRDGVADRLMKTAADRAAVGNQECGNGVVIDHGGGWETQYCHMRAGSIAVKAGDGVRVGERLGGVGYSGMAAFPHVHLSVRHNGDEIDPFVGQPPGQQSCGQSANPLWTDDAMAALTYTPGHIIRTGFAGNAVQLDDLENGTLSDDPPAAEWTALVAYAWAINLQAGDEIRVTITGPGGFAAENSATLDRAKAQYMLFAGKKRPKQGWRPGTYNAAVVVRNHKGIRLQQDWQTVIP